MHGLYVIAVIVFGFHWPPMVPFRGKTSMVLAIVAAGNAHFGWHVGVAAMAVLSSFTFGCRWHMLGGSTKRYRSLMACTS